MWYYWVLRKVVSCHILKKGGTQVLKSQLLYCLQIIYDYNFWLAIEQILDEGLWDRVSKNNEKVYKQEEDFHLILGHLGIDLEYSNILKNQKYINH